MVDPQGKDKDWYIFDQLEQVNRHRVMTSLIIIKVWGNFKEGLYSN